jgi:hypothetical protein
MRLVDHKSISRKTEARDISVPVRPQVQAAPEPPVPAPNFEHSFATLPIHDRGTGAVAQLKKEPADGQETLKATANDTGLPNALKSGVEALSGFSLDPVKVHFNSAKPAALNALAFAQGTDIHVGPGQDRHLPHEAWHVVQQAQGRVPAATQLKAGVTINDDAGLEREADAMGAKALTAARPEAGQEPSTPIPDGNGPIQRITNNKVAVDIGTLALDDAQVHLARLRRIRGLTKGAKPIPDVDAPFAYDVADEALLKTRIETLEVAALETSRLAVVADLTVQLAALGTAGDWANPPAWAGTTPTAGDGGETIGGQVAPAAAVERWRAFLGGGAYSHKHPRTGAVDNTRLVSADGSRSIRYGDHEKNSKASLHHFHEETWTYTAANTTLTVTNILKRCPVT